MIARIFKFTTQANSKGHKMCGTKYFRLELPVSVKEFTGSRINIKRAPDGSFSIRRADITTTGACHTITSTGRVTLSSRLVEEWEDLHNYDVDIDKETENVTLTKK